MKTTVLTLALAITASFSPLATWAQSSSASKQGSVCGSSLNPEELRKSNPEQYKAFSQREQRTQNFLLTNGYINGKASTSTSQRVTDPQVTITIPVVVHVVWNTQAQNISREQIQSQIDVLNEDFRRRNGDAYLTPSQFQGVAADANIEFQLACIDPNGNPTDGIVRANTQQAGFTVVALNNNQVNEQATGLKFVPGAQAWPADRYLNIWTFNTLNNVLGYAQFPGIGATNTDGVAVAFNAFGRTGGTRLASNAAGRVATHEIGHWLNLLHIWGSGNCGDDLCNDTPTQQDANFGCPSFPHVTCSNQGDMSMNYMDYTNDECRNLFTNVQKGRMRALFVAGGFRESFISAKIQQQAAQVCGNPIFSVAQNQGAAVTYQWTVSGALALTGGQGSTQITTTQTGTGTATIQVSANGYCDSKTVTVGPYEASGKYLNDYQEYRLVPSTYAQDPNFVTNDNVQITLDNIPGTTNSFSLGAGQPHYLYQTSNTTAVLYYNHSVNYADVYVTNTGGPCGSKTTWFSFYYPTSYSYAYSPNPSSNELTVQAQPQAVGHTEQRNAATPVAPQLFVVELYNNQGVKVASQKSQDGKAIVNVRDLPNGLYNLRIGQGKGAQTEHIQIVH